MLVTAEIKVRRKMISLTKLRNENIAHFTYSNSHLSMA